MWEEKTLDSFAAFRWNIVGSCHKLNYTFDVSVSISMTDRFIYTLGRINRWDNRMCMDA